MVDTGQRTGQHWADHEGTSALIIVTSRERRAALVFRQQHGTGRGDTASTLLLLLSLHPGSVARRLAGW